MDAVGPLVDLLTGPGMGGAAVGLAWALVAAIKRHSAASATKSEAEAAVLVAEAKTETASAGAVMGLLDQLHLLRRDLEREVAAREALQLRVDSLSDELDEARSRAAHLEGQVHVLTLEAQHEREEKSAAQRWAESLRRELGELRAALTAGHSTSIDLPPPWGRG